MGQKRKGLVDIVITVSSQEVPNVEDGLILIKVEGVSVRICIIPKEVDISTVQDFHIILQDGVLSLRLIGV